MRHLQAMKTEMDRLRKSQQQRRTRPYIPLLAPPILPSIHSEHPLAWDSATLEGQRCDVRDRFGCWFAAVIIKKERSKGMNVDRIKVKFDLYLGDQHDEWLELPQDRHRITPQGILLDGKIGLLNRYGGGESAPNLLLLNQVVCARNLVNGGTKRYALGKILSQSGHHQYLVSGLCFKGLAPTFWYHASELQPVGIDADALATGSFLLSESVDPAPEDVDQALDIDHEDGVVRALVPMSDSDGFQFSNHDTPLKIKPKQIKPKQKDNPKLKPKATTTTTKPKPSTKIIPKSLVQAKQKAKTRAKTSVLKSSTILDIQGRTAKALTSKKGKPKAVSKKAVQSKPKESAAAAKPCKKKKKAKVTAITEETFESSSSSREPIVMGSDGEDGEGGTKHEKSEDEPVSDDIEMWE